MKFTDILKEAKISTVLKLYKNGDERAKDTQMVGSITADKSDRHLTFSQAVEIAKQNALDPGKDDVLSRILSQGTWDETTAQEQAAKEKAAQEKLLATRKGVYVRKDTPSDIIGSEST